MKFLTRALFKRKSIDEANNFYAMSPSIPWAQARITEMEDDDDGFIDGESEVDEEDLQFNAKMAAREAAREQRRAQRAQEYGPSDWASTSSERAEE